MRQQVSTFPWGLTPAGRQEQQHSPTADCSLPCPFLPAHTCAKHSVPALQPNWTGALQKPLQLLFGFLVTTKHKNKSEVL